MSFDIYFQRFVAGDAAGGGEEEMRAVLAPHAQVGAGGLRHVSYRDGEVEIHLNDTGMIATHISGEDPWDLLVRGAFAAN